VSPWFEVRRRDYYDCLLGVSTDSRWDDWVGFFATGIEASATSTREQMLALVEVQTALKERVRASSLRANSAHAAVDFAVGYPSFTVRNLQDALGLTYGRTNKLVEQPSRSMSWSLVNSSAHTAAGSPHPRSSTSSSEIESSPRPECLGATSALAGPNQEFSLPRSPLMAWLPTAPLRRRGRSSPPAGWPESWPTSSTRLPSRGARRSTRCPHHRGPR